MNYLYIFLIGTATLFFFCLVCFILQSELISLVKFITNSMANSYRAILFYKRLLSLRNDNKIWGTLKSLEINYEQWIKIDDNRGK